MTMVDRCSVSASVKCAICNSERQMGKKKGVSDQCYGSCHSVCARVAIGLLWSGPSDRVRCRW